MIWVPCSPSSVSASVVVVVAVLVMTVVPCSPPVSSRLWGPGTNFGPTVYTCLTLTVSSFSPLPAEPPPSPSLFPPGSGAGLLLGLSYLVRGTSSHLHRGKPMCGLTAAPLPTEEGWSMLAAMHDRSASSADTTPTTALLPTDGWPSGCAGASPVTGRLTMYVALRQQKEWGKTSAGISSTGLDGHMLIQTCSMTHILKQTRRPSTHASATRPHPLPDYTHIT